MGTLAASIENIKTKYVLAWLRDQLRQPRWFTRLFIDRKAWGAFSIYSHLRRSDGKPKNTFPTRIKAQKSAEGMAAKYNAAFAVYRCMYCKGWHVSKTGNLPHTPVSDTLKEPKGKYAISNPANLDVVKILSTKIPDLAPVYGGFRGRSLSSHAQRYAWNTIVEAGIHQIIDLREDYKSDSYRILCERSGVGYFKYPVVKGSKDVEGMMELFPKFCKLIDEGGFYIACAEGLHRTDIALCTYWVFYAADKGIAPPELRGYREDKGKDTSKIMQKLNAIYKYLTKRDGKEPMAREVFTQRKEIIKEQSKT